MLLQFCEYVSSAWPPPVREVVLHLECFAAVAVVVEGPAVEPLDCLLWAVAVVELADSLGVVEPQQQVCCCWESGSVGLGVDIVVVVVVGAVVVVEEVADGVVGLELGVVVAVAVVEVVDAGRRWTADPFVGVAAVGRPAVDSLDPRGVDTPG